MGPSFPDDRGEASADDRGAGGIGAGAGAGADADNARRASGEGGARLHARVEASESPSPRAPTGRLADRIRALRERCYLGLGADTFERAYRYLKVQKGGGRGGVGERVRRVLHDLM